MAEPLLGDNPSGNAEDINDRIITEQDIQNKLSELGKLEKKIFQGDGNIGGNSQDTQIDSQYTEALEKATTLQTKLKIIQDLIDSFSSSAIDYSYGFSHEYMTHQAIHLKEKIEGRKDKLTKKYNGTYKKGIIELIQKNIDVSMGWAQYLESEYTDMQDTEKGSMVIIAKIEQSYAEIGDQILTKGEIWMDEIEKNPAIQDKGKFFEYMVSKDMSLNFNSFEDMKQFQDIQINNSEDEMYTFVELMTIDKNKLKQLQDKKGEEFVKYLDSAFTPEEKSTLLFVDSIKKKYTLTLYGTEKSPLGIDALTALSCITNKDLKKTLQKVTTPQEIQTFIDTQLGEVLQQKENYVDKAYVLNFLTSLIVFNTIEKGSNLLKQITSIQDKLYTKASFLISKEITNISPGDYSRLVKDGIISPGGVGGYTLINNSKKLPEMMAFIQEKQVPEKEKPTITEEKRKNLQNQFANVGLTNIQISDTGKMINSNGTETIQQKIGKDGHIEINADGKMVLVSSFGYRMEYENNGVGIEQSLETIKTFQYLKRIGLGYFGDNLKPMLEQMKQYLPNQTGYLSIDEKSGNFLNIQELNLIVIPVFQNIGFITKNQNLDYLFPEEITDTTMAERVKNTPFEQGKNFNNAEYQKLLQKHNTV